MSIFGNMSSEYGGALDTKFDQSSYISQFPKNLHGGCCMALCCCWIASNGNAEIFKGFIHSQVGKAHVRGFQGLAQAAPTQASNLGGGYYTGYVMEVLKVFRVKFNGEMAMRDSVSAKEIVGFVSARPAMYQLHISGAGGGHALAFRNNGSNLTFFDPNFGQVSFSKDKRLGLYLMFNAVLGNFYSDLNGLWECMRVY